MDNNKIPKNPLKTFTCDNCNYTTCNLKDYKKHLSTAKHQRIMSDNDLSPKIPKQYICPCGNKYRYSSGLSKHKNKCKYIPPSHSIEMLPEPTMEYLLKENLEMKKMMIELCKNIGPTNITNNNCHNKNFNINIFLNEECKDAMNLTDFVDSIQLSIEDMLRIGNDGQTSGMSNILIDKLNALDIVKRPLHCSDTKKEVIYVKDDDKWEKEERNNPKIKNALESLTNKTIKAMPCLENNPDEYLKTISEVLKEPREDNKIISDVAKEITI